MIYVYAIAGYGDDAPPLEGIGGAAVTSLRHGELAAFYSEDAPRDLAPSEGALLLHEAVVETLMDDRDVLPMRFGAVLADEDDLRAFLAERQEELLRCLERVRGCVELGVRAWWREPPADPEPAGSGRDYLMAKVRRREAAARVAQALHPPLAEMAAASRHGEPRDPEAAFAGAYLVPRAGADALRRASERLGGTCADVDVVCTGPWPPYSFTRADDA